MKMSDRRKDLRPREKLQARGAEALSDYELLMAIIGSGTQYADVTKPGGPGHGHYVMDRSGKVTY